MKRPDRLGLALSLLLLLASCAGDRDPARAASPPPAAGVVEVGANALPEAHAGQTVYVPAYSSILIADKPRPFDLAITLSIRNTDARRPIVVRSVRYHGQGGQLLREFLPTPVQVAPLASSLHFVQERDRSGGISSSFPVEWLAGEPVSDPVIEAVMVGTAGSQGISFTSAGRVLADRRR